MDRAAPAGHGRWGVALGSVAFAGLSTVAAVVSDQGSLIAIWAWGLTAAQLNALYLIGSGVRRAWLLSAGVQLAWAVYGVRTAQIGFVPGCLVALVLNIRSFRSLERDPDAIDDRRLTCQDLQ